MRVSVIELPGPVTADMHVLNENVQVSRKDKTHRFVYEHKIKGDAPFTLQLADNLSGATWIGNDSVDYPALLDLLPFNVTHASSGRVFTFKFIEILGVLDKTLTIVFRSGLERKITASRLCRLVMMKAGSMRVSFQGYPSQAP